MVFLAACIAFALGLEALLVTVLLPAPAWRWRPGWIGAAGAAAGLAVGVAIVLLSAGERTTGLFAAGAALGAAAVCIGLVRAAKAGGDDGGGGGSGPSGDGPSGDPGPVHAVDWEAFERAVWEHVEARRLRRH